MNKSKGNNKKKKKMVRLNCAVFMFLNKKKIINKKKERVRETKLL